MISRKKWLVVSFDRIHHCAWVVPVCRHVPSPPMCVGNLETDFVFRCADSIRGVGRPGYDFSRIPCAPATSPQRTAAAGESQRGRHLGRSGALL